MVSIGFYQGVACYKLFDLIYLSFIYFFFFNVWVCFFLFLCVIFSGFLSIWLFNPLIIIVSIRYGMVRVRTGSIKLLDFFGIVCLGFMRCNYVLNFRIWALFLYIFYNLGLSWIGFSACLGGWGCNLKFLVLSTVPFSKIVLDNVWHGILNLGYLSLLFMKKNRSPILRLALRFCERI